MSCLLGLLWEWSQHQEPYIFQLVCGWPSRKSRQLSSQNAWAFGQETAVHALRLMASGLFDAHAKLRIIIGHMGEGLPYSMWRVDNRNAWVKAPKGYLAKRPLGEYFRENFYVGKGRDTLT